MTAMYDPYHGSGDLGERRFSGLPLEYDRQVTYLGPNEMGIDGGYHITDPYLKPTYHYDRSHEPAEWAAEYEPEMIEYSSSRQRTCERIQRWAMLCPEVLKVIDMDDRIDPRDLVSTFYDLLGHISGNSVTPGGTANAGDVLYQDLKDSVLGEQRQIVNSQPVTRNSQKKFRILAEISRVMKSQPIGEVLWTFMENYHQWILVHNGEDSIKLWVRAVLRSSMTPEDKTSCLRKLLKYHLRIMRQFLDIDSDGLQRLEAGDRRMLACLLHENRPQPVPAEGWFSKSKHALQKRLGYGGNEQLQRYHRAQEWLVSQRGTLEPSQTERDRQRQIERAVDDVEYYSKQVAARKKDLERLTGGSDWRDIQKRKIGWRANMP